MPYSYADTFTPLLYNALEEEIGLLVRSDDAKRLRLVLHDAKVKARDLALQEVMILLVEPDMVYVAKRSAEMPE